MKLLVRIPNWIGDAVMATPTLHALRKMLPHAEITAFCVDTVRPIIEHNPHIDRIISVPARSLKGIANLSITGKTLTRNHYSDFLLLTPSFSSAYLAKKSGVHSIIGQSGECRGYFLTHRVTKKKKQGKNAVQHRVQDYLDIAAALAPLPKNARTQYRLELFLTPAERSAAPVIAFKKYFKKRPIGINPNANARSRRWPEHYWAELINHLQEKLKYQIVLFGAGSADEKRAQQISALCSSAPSVFVNKLTIREFIAVLPWCTAFITNDSGPMHIASAMNVPIFALEGAADIMETGAYNDHPTYYSTRHIQCSPCVKNRCPRLLHKKECMNTLYPKMVIKEISAFLSRKKVARR